MNDLPSSWRISTLGEIAARDGRGLVDGPFGSNLPASSYVSEGIPVIRGSNLSLGVSRFVDDEFVYVSDDTAHKLERSLCKADDIIFTKKGTLGQTAIVPRGHEYEVFLLSSNQMKLTVDAEQADALYIYYYVSSPGSIDKLLRDAEATGVPKTNLAYLRTFPVPLPPLAEQRAIAHILGSLDDKIELNRRMNATLEATARALFQSWFVDFDPVHAKARGEQPAGMDAATAALFPDSFEESELGLIPAGWRVEPIGQALTAVGGSTPSTKEPAYWEDGEISWATPKDLSGLSSPVLLDTERRITQLGLRQISSGLLPKGTVLLSSRAPVGYLAITEIPVAINQGFIGMLCDDRFPSLYALFWAEHNLDVIKNRASGTTFQEISKSNFRPILALVPPEEILRVFLAMAEPLYQQVVRNLEESRTLAETRDALLPKLVSGEVRVGDF